MGMFVKHQSTGAILYFVLIVIFVKIQDVLVEIGFIKYWDI